MGLPSGGERCGLRGEDGQQRTDGAGEGKKQAPPKEADSDLVPEAMNGAKELQDHIANAARTMDIYPR